MRRLVQVTMPDGTIMVMSYGYNTQVSCEAGNRTNAHAVSAAGGNSYGYDCNGNITQRVIGGASYTLTYDDENRQIGVSGAATATFAYDGDGKRVKGTVNGVTTTYIGSDYEVSGSTVTKYYLAGGGRVVMRTAGASGSTMTCLFGDQLSSTSATYRMSDGNAVHQLYKPWGEVRYASASLATPYTYTGQYSYTDDIATTDVTEGFGLMFYNTRFYDSSIMRWTSPDPIISG